jgi:serine/threonine protein kinase/Tol biopolymer transport system component
VGREEEAGSRTVRAPRYIRSLIERIAHYRLVGKLGQGGMGEVYRAVDERLGRSVAVKLLPPGAGGDERSQARLVREAQAASNLNHPGIVTVHDVGIWDDRVYFVMELVEGERFSELVRRGIEPGRAVDLCAQAAEALAVAHRRGILHRDIKPDNLMVTHEGRVKVLDFGLAKLRAETDADPIESEAASRSSLEALLPTVAPIPTPPPKPRRPGTADTLASTGDEPKPRSPWPSSRSSDPSLTEADALLGTPLYMSPEQASRQPVDARSEVYSLGLVLYELLTRRRPLARETLYETLAAAAAAELPPIEASPNMPRSIVPILKRALARDPEARYPEMAAFAQALAAVDTKRPVWRPPWVLASAAAGGVALATTAFVLGGDSGTPRPRFVIEARRPITAEPGCEEYPSFTPDGQVVVFDGIYQGDYEIQAMSVAGGAPRRLTRTPGWDIGAEVSRDGRHIAYVHFGAKGRELRVLPIEGDTAAPARVIGAIRGFPTWSRDGGLLYADDTGTVWHVALDGKPTVFARLPPDHIAPYLDQYRDGELVVAMKSLADTSPHAAIGLAHAGGSVRAASPAWPVHDSAHIRVDDRHDGLFFVKGTDSGALKVHWRARRGGEEIVLDRIESVANSFAISQRRDRLVYSSCTTNTAVGRLADGKFESLPVVSTWEPDSFAVVDDEHVILASMRSSSASRLWRVSAAGKAELLLDRPASEPAVSPDRALLAWRGIGAGAEGIYVRATAGGPITRLSDRAADGVPKFSHDARQVFFLRSDPAGVRVHAVPVTGGAARPITPAGVVSFASAPTADRLAVILSSGEERTAAVGPSGGPYTPITQLEQHANAYVGFTADGSKLLVSPNPSSLLEVDPSGGAPPRVVFSSTHETIHQYVAARDGVWALISSDEGDVIVVDGRF